MNQYEGEPTDFLIRSSALHGTIRRRDHSTLIDELPMIAVMAALQKEPLLSGMHRSFVSKSPTIRVTTENLRKMGADIQETEDGMIIHGGKVFMAQRSSSSDHRVAMSLQ